MTRKTDGVEFVVKPVASTGGASEFRQSMTPHPLVYQELAHDPHFGIYNGRLRSLSYGNAPMEDLYWRLRRQVMLSHTGELATEIRGPQAEALLERVFTRSIAAVRVGRCSYQIACYDDGGVMMDGVLMRFAPDHFWYVQSDGEFHGWLRAHAGQFDAEVRVTDTWISQVQGPRSMDVLAEVADEGMPERFRYFDMATIQVNGQPLVITRTGFTNELGWEFYLEPGADAEAIGDRILEVGQQYEMGTTPAEVTNARRIEGGLLFAGTDFDATITPFEAGFGRIVDLEKGDFAGREALRTADRRCRTWGLTCPGGTARHGLTVSQAGQPAGRVTSSAWSPTLGTGIAIVRLDDPEAGPGTQLEVLCTDGQTHAAEVCSLPLYDQAGDIPRGRATEPLATTEPVHAAI
ncbi:glycine cleavage system protein T [Spiribacter salinus M19-40]|uniref:Glycine cleavage system protein T n=1 Tax=Spiribacter salinus M19-40 TaxID=1260251 RepID=R4V589_9GAMM|nr:aminomethyltransferase family protein [Spiribacter salinus]AGM41104.1 glycine cleavage system protein T [Spiribacter salinus M19-40]